jgi:Ca2+-binding RTX toxin-like protein
MVAAPRGANGRTIMAINLPNGLLTLLGIAPSTIEISLSDAGNNFTGTNANEHILGNGGGDNINGGGGSDIIEGGAAGDNLHGGAGNDYIEGGAAGNSMFGDSGNDTLGYSQATSGVVLSLVSGNGSGGAQGDHFSGFENVVGSNFNDTITGNDAANILAGLAGNDILNGGKGDDILIGGAGADALNGGNGFDTADYSTSAAPIRLILGGSASTGGDAAGDTFISIENFVGTAGADVFDGSTSLTGFSVDGGGGNDTLTGSNGDDTEDDGDGDDLMSGGGGNDTLSDGAGNDTVFGGAGNDLFILGTGTNFVSGDEDNDTFAFFNDTLAGGSGDRNNPTNLGSINGGEGDNTLNFGNLSSGIALTVTAPAPQA